MADELPVGPGGRAREQSITKQVDAAAGNGGAKAPGYGGQPHPAAAQPKVPVNTKPVAPGVYGAPLGSTILK